MSNSLKNTMICISEPNRGICSWGIQIYSTDNPEIVERFRQLCQIRLVDSELGRKCETSHQGDESDTTWQYFEFSGISWNNNLPKELRLKCQEIAKELGFEGISIGEPNGSFSAV